MPYQPESDLVLADCVRLGPNGSGPEASRCARITRPVSGHRFRPDPDRMRIGSGMFTGNCGPLGLSYCRSQKQHAVCMPGHASRLGFGSLCGELGWSFGSGVSHLYYVMPISGLVVLSERGCLRALLSPSLSSSPPPSISRIRNQKFTIQSVPV